MEEDCCLMLICMSVKYWNVKGKDLSSRHLINTAGQKVLIIFSSKHDFMLLTKMVCVFILFLSKGVDLHHFDQLCHDMSPAITWTTATENILHDTVSLICRYIPNSQLEVFFWFFDDSGQVM